MKRALILVDLQNDFLPGGALAVAHSDQIIPLANALMPEFDLVVATEDWHPSDHGSFAANHPGNNVYNHITLAGLPQTLWPVHCVENTDGAAFTPALDVERIDRVFKKGTDPQIDSYSGFFDNNHLKSTGLGEFLQANAVTEIFVLGLATDYCVKATALDAIALGFRVTLIEDACRGVNLRPDDVKNAIDEMKRRGVTISRVADVIGAPTFAKQGHYE